MAEKKKNGHWKVRIIAMLLITAALGVSIYFEPQINAALGFTTQSESSSGGDTSSGDDTAGEVAKSIDLDVHFVDVGQGDACILELPDDRIMLIDSGEKDSEDKLIGYIDQNIRLNGEKIDGFDIVMITHSDSDHCGEMADVLEKYPAEVFYRPNVLASYSGYTDPGIAAGDLYGAYESKSTKTYRDAIEAGYAGASVTYATDATDDEQNVIRPEGIAEGEAGYYTITMYTPTMDTYRTGSSESSIDWNNYSPIMVLEYEGKKFALSGDAEKEAEAEFVALAEAGKGKYSVFGDDYYVDVIKLGHHGSRTSTSEAYLDVMTTSASCPSTLAIVSCGEGNSYGHPHEETLERLKAYGFKDSNILRTDQKGSIVLTVERGDGGDYALSAAFVTDSGSQSVDVEQISVPHNGGFKWRWLYIAGIIFAAAFILIIIMPSLTPSKRKKAVRKASDTFKSANKRK